MKQKFVLLLSKDESYLVKVSDRTFSAKSGILNLAELKEKRFGDKIETHLGKEFVIVEPTLLDFMRKKLKRMPQIVMPKDASIILAETGIKPNSLVVDAGSGSGYLCIFLAYYLSEGKVVTYEIRKDFYKVVKRNVDLLGLKNVEIKNKDITKGIDERNVDLITLDLKDASKVIKHAYKALKPGGWLVVYSPYIEQVIEVRKIIERGKFTHIKTIENVIREWQVEKYTRPMTTGIIHTGFLTFARKVS